MFVLEALVLTFITTPLVTWLYPPRYRVRTSATGANFTNIADGEACGRKSQPRSRDGRYYKTRFTVVLDKFEHLSGMMALTQLVNPSVLVSPWSEEQHARQPSSISIKSFTQKASQVIVEAIRVMELSDRVSAVMKSSAAEVILRSDPLLSAFRMFGALNDIRIVPSLAVVKQAELAYSIVEHAKNNDSDMIMIPWLPPVHDPYESVVKQAGPPTPGIKSPTTPNPFDMLFKPGAPSHHEASASVMHSQFVRAIFSQATTDVALYVDQSAFDATVNSAQHLFVPFFGGPDDRATLELVMQLCENPRVTATIVRFHRRDADEPGAITSPKFSQEVNALTVASVSSPSLHFFSFLTRFLARAIRNTQIPTTDKRQPSQGCNLILPITFCGQSIPSYLGGTEEGLALHPTTPPPRKQSPRNRPLRLGSSSKRLVRILP